MFLTLDKSSAVALEQKGGFINESGAYNTRIESAIFHEKDGENGKSQGIFLNVITSQKQKARFYINLSYQGGTENKGGKETINAIMYCAGLQGLQNPVPVMVKEYDYEAKQDVEVLKPCFTDLHDKVVGLIIQMVHEDGREHPNPSIYSAYNAKTGFTAGEIERQVQEATQAKKLTETVKNRGVVDKRKNKPSNSTPSAPQRQISGSKPVVEYLDDDIPF